MKKIVSLLVVLVMLMVIAPAAFAEDAPVGSAANPAELVLGENVAEVAANPEQLSEKGYYFTWTATEDGILTIDFSDEDANTPFVMFYVFNAEGDYEGSAELAEQGGLVELPVSEGYLVQFGVEEYDYQAATFHFTASFEAAFSRAGSGTFEDPWIVEEATTLAGVFTEEEANDENWMGYYYQFTATEAGVFDWSAFSGCGVFVLLNGEWVDGDCCELAENDVLLINIWANQGAGNYFAVLSFEAGAGEGGEGGEEGGVVTDGLNLGDNAFELPEGGYFGDVFVATEDGTLTILVAEMRVYDPEADGYMDVAPSIYLGRDGYYDLIVNDEEVNGNICSVEVTAGQEVSVYISTMTGTAAKATVNLSLEPAEEGGEGENAPSSGTVELDVEEYFVYEFTPEVDGVLRITFTSSVGYEMFIRDSAGDLDAAYWGQYTGEEEWVEEEVVAGVTYTISFTGHDGDWTYLAATITYDISFTPTGEGGEEGGEDVPTCTHENTIYLNPEYCYEEEYLFDLVETCWECGATFERYLPGTLSNPIMLPFEWINDYTQATATVTVPAGQTQWFGVEGAVGMMLVINGEEIGLLEPKDPWDVWSPAVFVLTNDTAEDVTYEILLSWPLGSDYNPDDLIIDETFELYLPENSYEYVYEWIATEDGVLTLVIEGDFWTYVVHNFTTYEYGEFHYAYNGDSNTCTLTVNAGDQIQIRIGTQDADWNFPETTLTISATFTPGEGREEPDLGTEENPVQLEIFDCPTTTIEIAPGTLAWYDLSYDFYDAKLIITGENAFVQYTYWDMASRQEVSATIYAENGVIELYPIRSLSIQIGNAGTETAVFDIDVVIPEGTRGNPADLVIGENVVDIEAGRTDYYFYNWYAPSNGTLTLTVSGDFWHFYAANLTSGEYSNWLYYYEVQENGEVLNVVVMEVSEGDVIEVGVSTCIDWSDPNLTDYTNPAGTITTVASFEGVETGCAHENLVHFEAIEPGCHYNGNIEYWVCYDCEGVWADEALTQVTNILSVVLPATGGEVTHFEAIEPGCHMNGQIEHWVCYECEQVWADEALTQVTNILSVVLPATGGEVVHVEAKAPTCTEEGNIEHWYCETCEQVWQDEALTQLTNHMNVKLGATGHTYVDGVCSVCGENDQNVPNTGDMTAVAFALIAVSGMTVIALPKKKEN